MCEKCNSDRSGESWKGLLSRYRITNICDEANGWRVDSASGHSYHVKSTAYIDRDSGSMGFRMECDCPARKRCRHIDAVMDMRYAEELGAAQGGDPDGIEIMERTN